MEEGFGFYWPPYSKPILVLPNGNVVPHEVDDYLPYIVEPYEYSIASSSKPAIGLPVTKASGDIPGAATPVGGSQEQQEASVEAGEEAAPKLKADPKSLEQLLTH